MTVSRLVSKSGPWIGDGVNRAFSYEFKVFDETHLEVVLVDKADPANIVERLQAPGSDYTVSGVGDAAGGSVLMTTAPSAENEIVIRRKIDPLQLVDLTGLDAWDAKQHEAAFDLLTMIAQQLDEEVGRVAKFSLGSDLNPDTLISEAAQNAVDAEAARVAAEASQVQAEGSDRTARNVTVTAFAGAGGTTVDLDPVTPTDEAQVLVTFDGVAQHHDTYSVAGSVITFDTQIPAGTGEVEVVVNEPLAPNVPSDRAVTQDAFAPGAVLQPIIADVTKEDAELAIASAALTFRLPFTLTLVEVRASLTTASTSGNVTVDVNEVGTSILSTPVTIEANEKTSKTAAVQPVIAAPALNDDSEITIDIDAAGTGAKGLKVTLIGDRAQ